MTFDKLLTFDFLFAGSNDLTRGKVTVEHHHYHHHQLKSPVDGPVSLETTYVIPASEHDSSANKKVRFIVQPQQQQPPATSTTADNFFISATKIDDMSQRRTVSFVDAVNSKQLDLSTGLFSSPLPFALSSSSFSSTSASDQHRHPHTHFSSASTPYATITATDNKNLSTASSSLAVNNHHSPVGADSNATATSISLKEAIDTNILDAHSAYVVDTVEQR